MTIEEIKKLQAENDLTEMQSLITSGEVWKFEGSYGRAAMAALESGACFLPEVSVKDYWGNVVPSRNQLKEGTKGTLQNSINYWSENG